MVGILLPGLTFALVRWSPAALPRSQHRRQAISKLYLQLREASTAVGIPEHLGPAQRVEHLRHSDLPQAQLAIRFLERYMEVRFGGIPLESGELQRWQQQLRQLRQAWQPLAKNPTVTSKRAT